MKVRLARRPGLDCNQIPNHRPRSVLTSKDGTTSITGDLIAIEDEIYVLEISAGLQRFPVSLVDCEGPGCIPQPDRTVELVGQNLSIVGEQLSFENNVHFIQEPVIGEIGLNASLFECRGAACP